MDNEEVRPAEDSFIAEAKVLCNGQLHAQRRAELLWLLFYNKHRSFNTPFRLFSERSSGFCLLSSFSVISRKS